MESSKSPVFGVDENSSTTLEEAKKNHRSQYLKEYRARYRRQNMRKDIPFTKEEYELISKEAKRHNKKFASFLKAACIAYINQDYLVVDDTNLRQLILQIRSIGRNINQIAFQVNRQGAKVFNEEIIHRQLLEQERAIEEALTRPTLLHNIESDTSFE